MSDEQAKLDRILKEKGYVHPEESVVVHDPYQIYNKDTKEGDESCYSAKPNSSVYGVYDGVGVTSGSELCPLCSERAMYRCSCELEESACSKGHIWYVDKKGKIVIGDPHE